MDNGTYQITGGQLTATEARRRHRRDRARRRHRRKAPGRPTRSGFEETDRLSLREDGPWLIGCRIDQEKPADTTERDPPRIRDQFMRGLGTLK